MNVKRILCCLALFSMLNGLARVTPLGTAFTCQGQLTDGPGWQLQETPTLSPPAWVNSSSSTNHPVVVPMLEPTKFYYLIIF